MGYNVDYERKYRKRKAPPVALRKQTGGALDTKGLKPMLTLSQSGEMVKVERPTQAFCDGYEDGKNGVDNSWPYVGGPKERDYKHGHAAGAGNFGKRIAILSGGSEQPYTPFSQPDSAYADVVPAEDRPEHVGV